jgi:hypothetical protein
MYDTHSTWRRTRSYRWLALAFTSLLAQAKPAHAQTTPPSASEEQPDDTEGDDAEKKPAPAEKGASAEKSEEEELAAEEAAADDELAAEEAAAAQAILKPPPAGKGGVWGQVRDTKFNEPIIEAQVQVLGRKEKALADTEGRYRLDLPPGTYRIRVQYELHRPSRIDDVVVKAGKLARFDVTLVPDESAVEEVLIEETVATEGTEGLTLTRKQSAVVGDGVGRADIARTPDRNAAEAAQRIPGSTIVGGRFVLVRGLGERYTNALLNGAPLPSPEPDRNTVPLDLFPSLVLDSLTIVKQFTPDMPADFAGGSVQIKTRDIPKETLFQLSLSGGYNTEATFKTRPGYYGSSTEWLGYDSGRRQFPPGIPNRRLSTTNTTTEEQVGYGYRFNTPMSTLGAGTPPNHGISLVAGDGYKIGKNKKLGLLFAFNYGRTYYLREITARKFRPPLEVDPGTGEKLILVGDDFTGTQGVDQVRWGAFGNASIEIERNHTISILGLRSQNADNFTNEMEGEYYNSAGSFYHTTHLEYVSRSLNFLQLRGQHRYPKHNGLEIDWHASIAYAEREQPDTRDVRYVRSVRNGEPGWQFTSDGSGLHSWFDQSDQTLAAGLNVLQPVVKGEHETKLKFGGLVTSRDRDFSARRFQFLPARRTGVLYDATSFCRGAAWVNGCAAQLFRPDLVRADGLLLDEWTLDLDQYETGLDVYGLYGMVDSMLTSKLRAVAGLRTEITYQGFVGYDPFDHSEPVTSQIYDTDYLPALSLVYAITDKSNGRFGASQTLARPQLREITPTLFTSYSGDVDVQGNPTLQITKITNLDLRYEIFPTLREVLAASLFYKHFDQPIEEVVSGNGRLSFVNAESAYVFGVELEARKTLDVLTKALKDFTVIGNVTLVTSKVDIGYQAANLTNPSRPMTFQSPYIVNLQLDYSNEKSHTDLRLLYNVNGPRIVAAGADGVPDVYEEPRHQLDFSIAQRVVKKVELKLQAQNILNQAVKLALHEQAYKQQIDPDTGIPSYTSLGSNPIVRSWNPGVTFTLSATYTY